MRPPLFDAHCHLQDARIGAGLEGMLGRARVAGVQGFAVCGCRPSDWPRVLELAQAHSDVLPFLGLHPWYVAEAPSDWLEQLRGLAQRHAIGIGECGLDFALEVYDGAQQLEVLRAHLRLARELGRPLSLHCRKAWEGLALLVQEEGLPAPGGLVHAFSGSPEVARRLQRLGLHLSFGCGLAQASHRRAARGLQAVAPDRLLFETDSPDLAPRHLPGYGQGRLNEPANLRLVLEAAAALRGEDPYALAEQVWANGQRMFAGLSAAAPTGR